MSGSKWSKMFFRNTLVAHKSLINPYFSGVVVQQAIVPNRIWILQKTLKALCFGGFLYASVFVNFLKLWRILECSTHVAHT